MICNMMVDIEKDGKSTPTLVRFGQLFEAEYVQISDDPEFADIYLSDGSIIFGINRGLFEPNEVEVKPYVEPQEEENERPDVDSEIVMSKKSVNK